MSGIFNNIPGYIYIKNEDIEDPDSLFQGDIIETNKEILELFKNFYPSLVSEKSTPINHIMITSQSCKLARRRSATKGILPCVLSHLNVSLIKPIENHIQYELRKKRSKKINDEFYFLSRAKEDVLKSKFVKFINNSDNFNSFFLPFHDKLNSASIALFNIMVPFKTDPHYDLFLKQRVISLKSEYRAKIGMILSDYHGRVATKDLYEFDSDWNEKKVRKIIKEYFDNYKNDKKIHSITPLSLKS